MMLEAPVPEFAALRLMFVSSILRSLRVFSAFWVVPTTRITSPGLNSVPKLDPNPARNEVDVTYIVAEKSSDQIQLQGGWGGGRVVGSLGLTFNNFSTRNFFEIS